jgi:hypothetical protein
MTASLVRPLQRVLAMTSRKNFGLVLLTLLAGLPGCSDADEIVTADGREGAARAPFSTAPGEPNHEEITATALSFLRADVLSALEVANVATDVEFLLVNANHFDDCNFTGGSKVVSTSQAEAVVALDPSVVTPGADLLVIRAFGRSIHAVQDFYAHTNWVELGGDVLVDSSLGAFPTLEPYSLIESSGFVVVQGRKPKHAALDRDEAAPYPASAVVNVKLVKSRAPGLISGTVDYEAGDFCPAAVAMTHEALNKDKSTNVGRLQQYEAAKTLAILQTEHEWCRLRALTSAKWGDAGLARLDTWLAADAVPPACE